MGFIGEFKAFAMRGNVVDLAVGVIIGAAFGKIVSSLIDDVIMPVVGKIVGNVDFTNLYIPLSQAVIDEKHKNAALSLVEARKLGAVLAWGNFATIVLNFLILAFIIFLMVKAMNSAKKKEPPAPPAPPAPSEQYLKEIRDLLARR
jgi:large conductance mechanosensitive channel